MVELVNYWNILLEKLKEVVETVSVNAIQNLDMIINNLGKGNFRYHPDDVVDALLCSENSNNFWKLHNDNNYNVLLSYGNQDLSSWFAKAIEMVKVMNSLKAREHEKTEDEKDEEWKELEKELQEIQSKVENDDRSEYTSGSDDDNSESTEISYDESLFNPDDDYASDENDINAQVIDRRNVSTEELDDLSEDEERCPLVESSQSGNDILQSASPGVEPFGDEELLVTGVKYFCQTSKKTSFTSPSCVTPREDDDPRTEKRPRKDQEARADDIQNSTDLTIVALSYLLDLETYRSMTTRRNNNHLNIFNSDNDEDNHALLYDWCKTLFPKGWTLNGLQNAMGINFASHEFLSNMESKHSWKEAVTSLFNESKNYQAGQMHDYFNGYIKTKNLGEYWKFTLPTTRELTKEISKIASQKKVNENRKKQ